jgi:hypothetical protein
MIQLIIIQSQMQQELLEVLLMRVPDISLKIL